jgi:hypothetical protein
MSRKNIFDGYSDGTFRPYQKINRAEATKVITLALGYTIETNSSGYFGKLFSDTSATAWYAKYLDVAEKNGIINGYPDGSFKPSKTINRVELLKIFLEGTQIGTTDCNYAPFNDTPNDASTKWYMPYACFVKENDLLGGENKLNLRPAEDMTRGDVADLFYEFDTRGLFYQSPGYHGDLLSTTTTTSNSTAYNNCLDNHSASYCDNLYGNNSSNSTAYNNCLNNYSTSYCQNLYGNNSSNSTAYNNCLNNYSTSYCQNLYGTNNNNSNYLNSSAYQNCLNNYSTTYCQNMYGNNSSNSTAYNNCLNNYSVSYCQNLYGTSYSNYNSNYNSIDYQNCLDTHTTAYCQNVFGYHTSSYYDSNNNGYYEYRNGRYVWVSN